MQGRWQRLAVSAPIDQRIGPRIASGRCERSSRYEKLWSGPGPSTSRSWERSCGVKATESRAATRSVSAGGSSSSRSGGRLKSEVAPLLAVLLDVNKQVAWLDSRLEHLAKSDETVGRLCTAPSVGPVTAAAFASTIDEPERFRGAHQVEAYLGLVPSEMSSGEKQHKGRITKAGNGRLRYLLVQVALSILRLRSPRTEVLRDWAERIAARRGRMIAVVALARRMAGILYAMMRDAKSYEPARPRLAPQASVAVDGAEQRHLEPALD